MYNAVCDWLRLIIYSLPEQHELLKATIATDWSPALMSTRDQQYGYDKNKHGNVKIHGITRASFVKSRNRMSTKMGLPLNFDIHGGFFRDLTIGGAGMDIPNALSLLGDILFRMRNYRSIRTPEWVDMYVVLLRRRVRVGTIREFVRLSGGRV